MGHQPGWLLCTTEVQVSVSLNWHGVCMSQRWLHPSLMVWCADCMVLLLYLPCCSINIREVVNIWAKWQKGKKKKKVLTNKVYTFRQHLIRWLKSGIHQLSNTFKKETDIHQAPQLYEYGSFCMVCFVSSKNEHNC